MLWPVALFAWVAFVNRFPQGYVYVSGDFAQPINIENIFQNLFYTWGNGISAPAEGGFFSWFAASPYYFVFYYVPHLLGLTDTVTLSYVLFMFLTLAYFSFLFALRLMFPRGSFAFIRFFSLLYPLNLTTIYFFTYTWGFSHQVFLYVTLPLVVATFYRFLAKSTPGNLLAFLFFLFLSISGFTNAAFFFASCLLLFLFLAFSLLLKLFMPNKRFVFALLVLAICSLAVLAAWLLPTYMAMRGGLSILTEGMFDLDLWLRTQSADVLSIFIGLPGYSGFFPFSHHRWYLYLPAFLPIFLTMLFLFRSKKLPGDKSVFQSKRLSLVLLCIYVTFLWLLKKGQGPFGETTLKIFTAIPALAILRSYEKVALFMPFLLLSALYGLIPEKAKVNKYLYAVLVITLFAAAPFLLGGIQTKYSITLGGDPTKNYTNAPYSGLVKIPSDYYSIAGIVNSDLMDTKVQDLPYSALNTDAWVNYPKWKLIGFNVTQNLFTKPTIGQNASQLNLFGWSSTLEFNSSHLPPYWYLRLLSYFNVSHLVYHKGVDESYISQSLPKIKELVQTAHLASMYDGESASLYRLDDRYLQFRFYVPTETYYLANDIRYFPYVLLIPGYHKEVSYLFSRINTSLPDEQNTRAVIVLEQPISLQNMVDYNWPSWWIWPPQASSTKPIDQQLRAIVVIANEMKSRNLYEDPAWQRELANALRGLRIAVKEEQEMHSYSTDKNAIVERVLKYLIKTNTEYVSQGNVHDFFLPLIYAFDSWAIPDLGKDCLYSCYKLEIPVTGNYEVLLERVNNLSRDSKLFLREMSQGSTISKVLSQNQELSDGNYLSFGMLTLTKDAQAILDLDYSKDETNSKEISPPRIVLKQVGSISGISKQSPQLQIQKINPTKYHILVSGASEPYSLVFSESFHEQWGLYLKKADKVREIAQNNHFMANGFANYWTITPQDTDTLDSYELIVEYKPQRFFYLGLIVSFTTLLIFSLIVCFKRLTIRKGNYE